MSDPGNLRVIVDALCLACNGVGRTARSNPAMEALPSRDAVVEMVQLLRSVIFPGYFGRSEISQHNIWFHVGSTLDRVITIAREQIRRGLCFYCTEETKDRCSDCERKAALITDDFVKALPRVQRLLGTDARAAYEGDPAATSADEAIFCYPGVLALTSYRLAHELHLLGVPLIPRIMTEHAHSITGIDIHPGATIGERFFIDHGTGVVIGETTEIGRNVRIYQGVTLGAKSFPLDENGRPIKGMRRHPIVEDDVIIYSGATILGRVTIGRGSVIGGNVWLTHGVAPGSRLAQAAASADEFASGEGI
ncbi:MAG: serine acetyltransferase [Deltaproteobacteria bacterium]|nr:serine acetyltransferase [Deltaproteobacteria bacterium]